MISKILVPVDGSDTAKNAAKYAIEIAKQFKASIIILNVIEKHPLIGKKVDSPEQVQHTIEPISYYLKEAAGQFTGEIKELCDESKIASEVFIKTGHPVTEIVREAKRSKADLIVMGSHGKNALSAAVLGSVSYGVIHHANNIHILIARG
jgi:nucleotide-binding universal stress UspA family protein